LLGSEAWQRRSPRAWQAVRRFIQSGQRQPAEFVILTRETLMIRPSTFTDSRRAVARPPRTQVGQHVDIKTVREQRCSSATAPYGEHLKRTALVRTERHGFGNITCPTPWRERAVAPG
jgi:hypothetical protein